MRNQELFNEVADYLEKYPEEYDQTEYACGTARCIAGTAVWLRHPDVLKADIEENDFCNTHDLAQELLGLDDDEADILFAPWWEPDPQNDLSVPEALREIGKDADIQEI